MSGGLVRTLTPLGWLSAFGVVVVLILIVGRGLGVRWDPLHLQARRLEAVQRRADEAEAWAAARALEAAARGRQIEALDAFRHQAEAVARATATAETRARTADDADTLLDPARAQRLRDHDRELCRLAPAVAGCAAASHPS